MAHKFESQPKIFVVQELLVIARRATEPPSKLVCFPEEALDFSKFVGKKVRVRSIFELVDEED